MGSNYYPIPTIIQVAKVCQVLSDVRIRKQKAFKGGTAYDEDLPIWLYIERKTLEWLYTYQSDYAKLEAVANYVWALCGDLGSAALTLISGPTGIVVNPTTGVAINYIGYRADFVIGEAGSLLANGDTTLTINLPGFIPGTIDPKLSGVSLKLDNLTGFGLVSITYTAAAATIVFNQPVETGQEFTILGARSTSGLTSVSSQSLLPSMVGHAGQMLFNDGTNFYWADAYVRVVSADFEADGVTYLDDSLADNTFDILWADFPKMLDPDTEFTRIVGGGFTISIAGFDANTTPYILIVLVKGLP